jgi:hypothetical protein
MEQTTRLAIIAIGAAIGVVGVLAVETFVTPLLQQQEAEAKGCRNGIAFNASKGRCFQP